jgi:hypothetical protein
MAPQPNQVPGEEMEIAHVAVAALQAVPPDQRVRAMMVVGPQLVLQELLAHEEHRHSRGGEQQPRGDPSSAPRIPGSWVAPVGQPGDAWLSVIAV